MSQVLRNLLSNALKFTPAGGVVTVRVNIVHDDLFVEVEDTGAGICPANIDKLFHNVMQFNANTLQGGGGTGLGLWISKKIIDLHGGTIGVRSAGEGLGSTFYFTLPIIERESDEISFNQVNRPASRANSSRAESLKLRMAVEMKQYSCAQIHEGGCPDPVDRDAENSVVFSLHTKKSFKKHVSSMFSPRSTLKINPESNVIMATNNFEFSELSFLIVDDSAMIRKYISAKLMREGCRVSEAEDGVKAVEFIQNILQPRASTPCDAIVIDNVLIVGTFPYNYKLF